MTTPRTKPDAPLRGRQSSPLHQYRLAIRPGETVGLWARRVLLAELDLVYDALGTWLDRDKAVHRSRQAMKRARSVLRLFRDEVGYFVYRQENVVLRDAARQISTVRSAAVQRSLARQLADNPQGLMSELEWQRLISGLAEMHLAERGAVVEDEQILADIAVTIGSLRYRIATQPLTTAMPTHHGIRRTPVYGNWEFVRPSIERVYRRGQRAMAASSRTRTIADFHEWRKRVKYLRHLTEALAGLDPTLREHPALDLNDLGELLGTEHDYAEFGMLIQQRPELVPAHESRAGLVMHLGDVRWELQDEALRRGAGIYHSAPEEFAARLEPAVSKWVARHLV